MPIHIRQILSKVVILPRVNNSRGERVFNVQYA